MASLKSRVDSASIPAAKKADIRAKIAILQVLEGAKNATGSLKFLSSSLISILSYLLHHFPYVNVSPICSELLCYDRIK